MTSIFAVNRFQFPYLYTFPGKDKNEQILFITRENKAVLIAKLIGVVLFAVSLVAIGQVIGSLLQGFGLKQLAVITQLSALALGALGGSVAIWWVYVIWSNSVGIITTKRLAKFIYTTPFNRHSLSLPLGQIVDTGAYTKGFVQAGFSLGTFTARSSAASSGVATDDPARVNKKYFYLENIDAAEDLQQYVNKLLDAYHHHRDKIDTFRPFIPHLKGEARRQFMENYPQYWS